jgi:hypothetical protein
MNQMGGAVISLDVATPHRVNPGPGGRRLELLTECPGDDRPPRVTNLVHREIQPCPATIPVSLT